MCCSQTPSAPTLTWTLTPQQQRVPTFHTLFYWSFIPKIDDLFVLAAMMPSYFVKHGWIVQSPKMNYSFQSILLAAGIEAGGGFTLYIWDTIPYFVYISHDSVDLLMVEQFKLKVELKVKRGNLLCGVFYHPPLSKSSDWPSLNPHSKRSPNKLISLALLDDFNIDLCNPNHPLQSHLHSIRDKLNLHQVVSDPTTSTSSTDTLI